MRIIETKSAPNPRRVRIFLAEKGITVPFEEIEFKKENFRSEAFTKLNPMQRIPVLVLDDGRSLSETVAICRYFEELHPEPALFGQGAYGKAEVEPTSLLDGEQGDAEYDNGSQQVAVEQHLPTAPSVEEDSGEGSDDRIWQVEDCEGCRDGRGRRLALR